MTLYLSDLSQISEFMLHIDLGKYIQLDNIAATPTGLTFDNTLTDVTLASGLPSLDNLLTQFPGLDEFGTVGDAFGMMDATTHYIAATYSAATLSIKFTNDIIASTSFIPPTTDPATNLIVHGNVSGIVRNNCLLYSDRAATFTYKTTLGSGSWRGIGGTSTRVYVGVISGGYQAVKRYNPTTWAEVWSSLPIETYFYYYMSCAGNDSYCYFAMDTNTQYLREFDAATGGRTVKGFTHSPAQTIGGSFANSKYYAVYLSGGAIYIKARNYGSSSNIWEGYLNDFTFEGQTHNPTAGMWMGVAGDDTTLYFMELGDGGGQHVWRAATTNCTGSHKVDAVYHAPVSDVYAIGGNATTIWILDANKNVYLMDAFPVPDALDTMPTWFDVVLEKNDGTWKEIGRNRVLVPPSFYGTAPFSVDIMASTPHTIGSTEQYRARMVCEAATHQHYIAAAMNLEMFGAHYHSSWGATVHTHTFAPTTHDHTMDDPLGHYHVPVQTPHPHDPDEVDHTHDSEYGLVDSYPTDVKVLVNSAVVLEDAGGEAKTLNVDITNYLIQGENKIEVVSKTPGAVRLSADYWWFGG